MDKLGHHIYDQVLETHAGSPLELLLKVASDRSDKLLRITREQWVIHNELIALTDLIDKERMKNGILGNQGSKPTPSF